jgi:hypothetical protein
LSYDIIGIVESVVGFEGQGNSLNNRWILEWFSATYFSHLLLQ